MMMFSPVTDTDQGPTGDKAGEWARYLGLHARTQQQSVISLPMTGWTFTTDTSAAPLPRCCLLPSVSSPLLGLRTE
jgi:hypothetical protein